jgi:hypothetical protein
MKIAVMTVKKFVRPMAMHSCCVAEDGSKLEECCDGEMAEGEKACCAKG